MTRTTVRGGSEMRRAALLSLALAVTSAISACGAPEPSEQRIARVERGTVTQLVSASGALSSVIQQNLGFQKTAKLKELRVKVGDVVQPGQVLAVQEDFTFRKALEQQRAVVDQAEATLRQLLDGVDVPNAKDAADQVDVVFEKTKSSIEKQVKAARDARNLAKVKYEFDLKQLHKAEAALAACTHQPVAPTEDVPDDAAAGGGGAGTDPTAGTGRSGSSSSSSSPSGTAGAPAPSSPLTGSGGLLSGMAKLAAPDCGAQEAAVVTAKNTVIASKTAYVAAKNTLQTTEAGGQVTIESARSNLVTAQNALRSAKADRPGAVDAQRAVVAAAQAQLDLSQYDLDNTVLRSPVGGTVSAITGTIGETIAGGVATTALAPGTKAAIPGVGAAATSDTAGLAASGLSATRPGGGAFIVLNGVDSFQVVVPFEESDAAKVQPNQKVRVTFDAVPGLEREGTVLSIAPGGLNISGVTNYYATILLAQGDPRLRTGMTAETGVVTGQKDNVLMVPNSAVIEDHGQTFVNVPGPDGQAPVRKPIQRGTVGGSTTEVVSGLREGESVLLPSAGPAPGN
jgi:HlyD family secretion protein